MNVRMLIVTLILGLSLINFSTAVNAEPHKIGEVLMGDGDDNDGVAIIFENDDGSVSVWWEHNDHTVDIIDFTAEEWNDRDAEGGDTSDAANIQKIKDAIKRMAHGGKGPELDRNNPIIEKRTSQGKGIVPIWNPPEDMRGAPGSSHTGEKPTPGSLRDKSRRGKKGHKREKTGKTIQLTKPGYGGMGTRDDSHPERVNPKPEL